VAPRPPGAASAPAASLRPAAPGERRSRRRADRRARGGAGKHEWKQGLGGAPTLDRTDLADNCCAHVRALAGSDSQVRTPLSPALPEGARVLAL
jgi:hypothetical protein